MSVLQKALAKTGLELEGDALPRKQRRVKVFQRLIAAVRAAEGELQDQLNEAERECNEALRRNIFLQEENRCLREESLQHRLKSKLTEIESLTTSDRTKLLELSGANQNAA